MGADDFQADRAIDEKAPGQEWTISVGETAGDSFKVVSIPAPGGSVQDKQGRTDCGGPVISTEIHVNSVGKGELLNILKKRLIQHVM